MEYVFYLIRRLVSMFVMLVGLTIVVFVLSRIMPGDPVRAALGPRAPETVVQQLREKMHLDESIPVQYFYWLGNVFRGDFGRSLTSRRPVLDDIKDRLAATVELVVLGAAFMTIVGIPLGIIAARYKDKWLDNAVRMIAYTAVSVPSFAWSIFLLLIFAYVLHLLPITGRLSSGMQPPPTITGMYVIDGLITGNFATAFDALKHLILPSVSLSLGGLAQCARITRAGAIENAKKDYIDVAKACNIPNRIIIFQYLLKPSLIPTVSILGLNIAVLFGNAFLVEWVFRWPGISSYGIVGLLQKDVNVITAVILLFGIGFLASTFLVDIMISYLNPRIRLGVR